MYRARLHASHLFTHQMVNIPIVREEKSDCMLLLPLRYVNPPGADGDHTNTEQLVLNAVRASYWYRVVDMFW